MAGYPEQRPRRLRRSESLRGLVRETIVRPADLVLPLFVRPGKGVRQAVSSMPGVDQTSADELVRDAAEALVRSIVADGQAAGAIRDTPADELAQDLTALMDGLGIKVLTGLLTADQMYWHLESFIDRNIVNPGSRA